MERQCPKCQEVFEPSARHIRRHQFTCRECENAVYRKRTGALKRGPLTPETLLFRCSPVPGAGCWLWAGAWDEWGYGRIRKANRRAHRVSYELHNGPIPKGLMVCHRCNTPACVNPSHLYAGTHAENMLDRRGRPRKARNSQEARA